MKILIKCLMLLFITILPVEAVSPYAAIIRLSSEANILAPVVRLGEIATIETEDQELEERLNKLILAKAPKIDSKNTISSYTIKNILRKEGFEKIKLFGFQTEVQTLSHTINRDELKKRVEEWVSHKISENHSAEITFKSMPSRWSVPAGTDTEIRIETKGQKDLRGNEYITIRSLCDDQVFSSTHTRIHVALFAETAVITRPIKKGDPLSKEDIEIRRSDVTNSTGMETNNYETILGMIAKHDIKSDSLLSVNDFELPIIIKRGSINKVIVVNGSIRMNLNGARALQNGRTDDVIMFKNPMNKKENIHAKVVKEGLALLQIK